MKIFLLSILFAVAFFESAFSQTVVRIVGSPANRRATQWAIADILGSGWVFQGTAGNTSSAGSLTPVLYSYYGTWYGTYGGTPVRIKVSYIGGATAVASVAGHTSVPWTTSGGTGVGAIPEPPTFVYSSPGPDYEIAPPDFGISENFQASTPYIGLYNGTNYSPLIEEKVSIIPIVFVASPGFPANNITTPLASLLYGTGAVSLGQFTANLSNGDQNKIVYALGRNVESGTRLGTYSEIGLGTSSNVRVWKPVISGATYYLGVVYGGVANSHELWPAETTRGIYTPLGTGGFWSGTSLGGALNSTLGPAAYKGYYEDPENPGVPQYLYPNATAGYYIGYLSAEEAAAQVQSSNIPVANRGIVLKYNGIEYNAQNLRNGLYSAWVYNQTIRTIALSGLKLNIYNSIRDQIKYWRAEHPDDATFKVQRFTDGGLVVPK